MDKHRHGKERDVWENVKRMLGDEIITLGNHWSYNLHNDPKRLAFVLSRYKFAAKMGSAGRRVIELGCSEGIGATILAESALSYLGVDMDAGAIESAKKNFSRANMDFIEEDFLEGDYGVFDSVVSLDVIEHISSEHEHLFFDAIFRYLDNDGIAIVGTPNATSEVYASEASRAGHVNLFDAARLRETMHNLFHRVFIFGGNDEIVHTGFSPMCHYLFAVGCCRRDEVKHG